MSHPGLPTLTPMCGWSWEGGSWHLIAIIPAGSWIVKELSDIFKIPEYQCLFRPNHHGVSKLTDFQFEWHDRWYPQCRPIILKATLAYCSAVNLTIKTQSESVQKKMKTFTFFHSFLLWFTQPLNSMKDFTRKNYCKMDFFAFFFFPRARIPHCAGLQAE